MGVRQSEPSKAQNTPTQRQVYTIDGEETPATPAKHRGTTVEREATPQQAGTQLMISDGTVHNNSDTGNRGDANDCGSSCDTTYSDRERNSANNDPKRNMDGQRAHNGDD